MQCRWCLECSAGGALMLASGLAANPNSHDKLLITVEVTSAASSLSAKAAQRDAVIWMGHREMDGMMKTNGR